MENKKIIEERSAIFKEKDVLGLVEPMTSFAKPNLRPGNLFMGIGIVIVVIYILYRVIGYFY
jgi:hypothetical protein